MFLGKAVHLGPRNNCLDQIYLKYIDYLHSKDAALDNAHTPVLSLYTYDAELSQRMCVSIEQEKNMHRYIDEWNSLPKDIVEAVSISNFKRRLYKMLIKDSVSH